MVIPIRRVLTGPNPDGGSGLLLDGYAPHVVVLDKTSCLARTDIWATSNIPYDNSISTDPTEDWPEDRFGPLPSGTSFFVMQIPPDDPKNQPSLHVTDTLDYIIILRGEVYAVFEDSETLLRAGDIVVQRGTRHSWSNRSNAPCIFAAIMFDALKHNSNMK